MNALMLAVLLSAGPVKSSATVVPPQNTPGPEFAGSETWFDGRHERTLWLSVKRVAELNPNQTQAQSLTNADSTARVIQTHPTVRLWAVDDAQRVRQGGAFFAPVYFEAQSGSSRFRVAVGGVNLFLKKTVTQAERAALLKELHAEVKPSGLWLVPCAPAEALATAQQLNRRAEIELATPNWWVAPHKR